MENRDSGVHLPEKLFKMSSYDDSVSPLPTNGIAGSPDVPAEQQLLHSPDMSWIDHLDNDKINRIPVNAVKPRPSSPGAAKLPSTSSMIKVAVMQQQARLDEGGGPYYQAKSPRGLTTSPRSLKQDTVAKRSSVYAPKGTPVPSPSSRDSPLSLSQSITSPAQASNVDKLPHSSHGSSAFWVSSSDGSSHCSPLDIFSTLESMGTSSVPPSPSQLQHNSELHRPTSEGATPVSDDADGTIVATSEHKRRKYRSRDYSVNLEGQKVDDAAKPVRLKERRLTFDPVTGQIKPLVHREPSQTEEAPVPAPYPVEFRQRNESTVHQLPAPVPPSAPTPGPGSGPGPSPFHQTNWKELSRNEIIQSYLNLQSNLLTSSGVQAPGAHFFMSEYLKREDKDGKDSQVHALQTDRSVGDLPGVTREVTAEDLERIHTQPWSGVNGCYDTKGTWYDWTECISLDPHGDENKLNILPYVCLDWEASCCPSPLLSVSAQRRDADHVCPLWVWHKNGPAKRQPRASSCENLKILVLKRVVEFVIPRAVSVLFFKLKITGITRPWSRSAAGKVEKETKDWSQIPETVPRAVSSWDDAVACFKPSNLRISIWH